MKKQAVSKAAAGEEPVVILPEAEKRLDGRRIASVVRTQGVGGLLASKLVQQPSARRIEMAGRTAHVAVADHPGVRLGPAGRQHDGRDTKDQ
jgi:hypothetical protein